MGIALLAALACFGAPAVEAQPVYPEPWPPKRPGACDRVIDITFPDDTQFPYVVDFKTGATDLRQGDKIVIKEVRGTHRDFRVGGIYLVRGEYVLDSRAEARLSLTVTATRPGDGCTKGNSRGLVTVRRGAGTFELASPIAYPGHPHVWFRVGDRSIGGVYFGSGPFLKR